MGFNYLEREYAKFIISSQYKPCIAHPNRGRRDYSCAGTRFFRGRLRDSAAVR
jgi:hypothetical protein